MTLRQTRLLPSILAALACCPSGCADSEPLAASQLGAARSAIVNGKPSDASQDAVVLVVSRDRATGALEGCTGTMLSPRLVLTARHCVAVSDPNAGCSVEGKPVSGGAIQRNHEPNAIYVLIGKSMSDFSGDAGLVISGRGMTIAHDGAKNVCNHDIALIEEGSSLNDGLS